MQLSVLLKDIAGLLKLRLSVAVGLAAAAGFMLASGEAGSRAAVLFICMLALAAGAACLNNCQDAHIDADMERTRNRPIPAGRIKVITAVIIALFLLAAGGVCLVMAGFHPGATQTAWLAVFLYNGIYTPLKRYTSLAMIPGVVCGSLSPLIGWLAAGGCINAPAAWSLMVIFALWQPPHFWLVVIEYSGDYMKDELPSMLRTFSKLQLSRILFAWIAMLGISLLTLPLAMGIASPLFYMFELVNVLALTGLFGLCLLRQRGYRLLFAVLNTCVAAGVTLVIIERLLGCL